MKLIKEDIQFIDEFLIRHHVKFIDARIEIIDHLALEYESGNTTEKLHAFLMKKRDFIKVFVKERQKKIHWAYQKKLLQEVTMFFYKPKHTGFTLLIGFTMFGVKQFNVETVTMWAFIISIVIPLIIAFYKQIKASSKLKNIQSYQTLGGIMSLPSLFLYMITPFKSIMPFDSNIFYIYWFAALIFGLSGLMVFNKLLKETATNYNKIVLF